MGEHYPAFTATDIHGAAFSTASVQGRVFVVHLLGIDERADAQYAAMANASANVSSEVRFVTIATGPLPRQDMDAFLAGLQARHGGHWPLVSDPSGAIVKKFQPRSPSKVYVFDQQGKEGYEESNEVHPACIGKIVHDMLADPAGYQRLSC